MVYNEIQLMRRCGEMADATDSKSVGIRSRVGSSPTTGTFFPFSFLKWPVFAGLLFAFSMVGCSRVPTSPLIPQPSASASASPIPKPSAPVTPPSPPVVPKNSMEETYAPVLILDSRERSPLTSVEKHLMAGVALKGDRDKKAATVKTYVSGPELAAYKTAQFTLNGEPHELYLDARKQVAPMDNVVYTNKTEAGGFTYLQYWFFYSFNDTTLLGGPPGGIVQKCGNHEADWEHISLKINTKLFERATTEQELRQAIDDIYLSQHTRFQFFERKWFRPNQAPINFEGSHIRVFPANGSHATYPAPGDYSLLSILGFKVKDINDGGGLKIPTHKGRLVPFKDQIWAKYGGRWGAISHDICNVVEFFSPASNDGPYGPTTSNYFYQSDWYGVNRPSPTMNMFQGLMSLVLPHS